MAILIGLIFVALGISVAVGQWSSFVIVLQSVLALGLMFWGGIAILIGYSEMKARRTYSDAVNSDKSVSPQKPVATSDDMASVATNNTTAHEADNLSTPAVKNIKRDNPPVSPAQ